MYNYFGKEFTISSKFTTQWFNLSETLKSHKFILLVRIQSHQMRHREREFFFFFKELVYVIVRNGKSETHRTRQQAGNSVKSWGLSSQFAGQANMLKPQVSFPADVLRQNCFFKKSQSFFSRPSTDWLRLTHCGCFTESQLLTNTFIATSSLVFDQATRHHSIAKLTHKH